MFVLLIALHAIAALAAFGLGCAVIRPPVATNGWPFRGYLAALVLMVVFLVPAIALNWDNNNPIGRIVFAALAVLALGMVGRAWLARTTRPQDARYIEHVGFTLIALFDGFVIITAKDLGAPVWLLLVVAVAGVLAGRAAIARVIAGSSQHAAAS